MINNNSPVNSNEQFVPSTPPKQHDSFTSHDVHVNSRPHNLPHQDITRDITRDLTRDLTRDSSTTTSNNTPQLQNSRNQFESSSSIQNENKPNAVATDSSQSTSNKPKPAHTVVKNGDGKKDDVVIYYYYYYDDDKNKTVSGGSGANTAAAGVSSVDVIPSLDQYDNVPVKKTSTPIETTQSPKQNTPIVSVANNKPAEFKIDGNTFKFDTTGFTPITTPNPFSANNNNNLFRSQDRGVHVHNNPLYGNGKFNLVFLINFL